MTPRSVARALREVAFFLQLKGENPFKIRAYETAAARFEELPQDALDRLLAEGRLTNLPGVGEAIATKVAALAQTGALPLLEELRRAFPAGLLEVARVPDLGPKRIAALHRELGVGSLAELRRACEDGRVRALAGFGEKTEAKSWRACAPWNGPRRGAPWAKFGPSPSSSANGSGGRAASCAPRWRGASGASARR